MPIIYEDRVRGAARSAYEVPSSTGEVLTATFAQAYEENPIKAVRRYLDLREDERTGPRLDAETARSRLKDAGMESDLTIGDAGITEAALSTLMERKRVEKRRQETFGLAEGGIGQGAAKLGVAALTSLVDPVSAGLNFVPVMGQARYARLLANAGGLLGRTGVRAGVGAVEGAVGAAMVEPLIYSMRTQEQADYDAVDSLLNVTLGGFVGAGLHTTVGSLGDLYGHLRPDTSMDRLPGETDRDFMKRVIDARATPDITAMSRNDLDYVTPTDTSVAVPVSLLEFTKTDTGASGDNALKRFQAAARGEIARRSPISVEIGLDGKLRVVDGNGTLDALQKVGITQIHAEVNLSRDIVDSIAKVDGLTDAGRDALRTKYLEAARAKAGFDSSVSRIAEDAGGQPVLTPLKTAQRAADKIAKDFGGDVTRIRDILRATVEVADSGGAARAVSEIQNSFNVAPGSRNLLDPAANPIDGYRDAKFNVIMPNGHVAEVQVNLPEMLEVKNQVHHLYEARENLLREVAQANRLLTDAENARIDALNAQMKSAYDAAWAAALARTEATRSSNASSAITTPLRDAESNGNSRGGSTSQALQPGTLLPTETGTPSTSKNDILPPTGDSIRLSQGGAEVKANQAVSKVYTSTGRVIEVRAQVVEAASLTTSDQAGYPAGVQPRQRGERASSEAQVAAMAADIKPEMLGITATAHSGAPIVGPDGAVESGNGRVMAIRRAYEDGNAASQRYRQWLESQGYDVAGMRAPVLVRERLTPLSDAERQAFAVEANKPGVMAMSPVERAQADAVLLDEALLSRFQGDDVTSVRNAPFVQGFVQKLAPAERNALTDANGRLGQEGVRRIQAAMLSRAYGGTPESVAVLSRMLEATDSDARSVLGALLDAAPAFARLRDAVQSGHVDPVFDLSRQIAASVEELARIRASGQSVRDALNQGGLFGPRDVDVDALIRAYHNDALTRLASRERIAGTLSKYADDAAKQNINQSGLFGDSGARPEHLLNSARAAFPEPKGGGGQVDLFAGSAAQRVASATFAEREAILRTAVAQAASGQPINVQRALDATVKATDTPAFKRWFGDSKVVDADGKPLRVYHGTRHRDIHEFRISENGEMGAGIYFAGDADRAALYAEGGADNTGQLIPVYVSIRNPAPESAVAKIRADSGYQRIESDAARGAEVMGQLKDAGYDGIIRYKMNGGISEVVAFEPNQVKSAVGNSGAFDPNSASLTDPPTMDAKDYAAAQRLADDVEDLPAPVAMDEVTQAVSELANLAESDARETAKRLGIDLDDPDMAEVAEAIQKGERWARAAELATVCLVRGG